MYWEVDWIYWWDRDIKFCAFQNLKGNIILDVDVLYGILPDYDDF